MEGREWLPEGCCYCHWCPHLATWLEEFEDETTEDKCEVAGGRQLPWVAGRLRRPTFFQVKDGEKGRRERKGRRRKQTRPAKELRPVILSRHGKLEASPTVVSYRVIDARYALLVYFESHRRRKKES